MNFPKIHCKNIPHRSGFVEVRPNIHSGHINIEIWNLEPGYDRDATDVTDDRLSDADITSNTEIELDIPQALELIRLLSSAVAAAGNST
jgi:hypothetical protein